MHALIFLFFSFRSPFPFRVRIQIREKGIRLPLTVVYGHKAGIAVRKQLPVDLFTADDEHLSGLFPAFRFSLPFPALPLQELEELRKGSRRFQTGALLRLTGNGPDGLRQLLRLPGEDDIPPSLQSSEVADEDNSAVQSSGTSSEQEQSYVLNTNTRKFHLPSCSSAEDILPANRQDYTGTRDELIAQGYTPCGRCKP